MLFSAILRLYDNDTSLNLNRVSLYATGEEITKTTINKIGIVDQLFPLVKIEESLGDICDDSYKVGS